MNQLHSCMSNVLLGTMASPADAAAIGERYRAAGGDAERLVVLGGRDGIEALEGPAGGPTYVAPTIGRVPPSSLRTLDLDRARRRAVVSSTPAKSTIGH